jgi:RHS repeat-associated protein
MSATVGGATSAYTHDGDGKRASSTVGGTTTRYIYDVAGGLPVLLDDGTRKYVYGLGLAYAVTGSSIEVYHTDGLGSVRALTDAAGAVTATSRTDEFGIPTAATGSSGQPFGYTGEQRDGETGLVYLRARMYDPATGRFMQRDPFAGRIGSPLSRNRYSYVLNNPVNLVDPSGLDSQVKDDLFLCQRLPKNIWEWALAEQCFERQSQPRRDASTAPCPSMWLVGPTALCTPPGVVFSALDPGWDRGRFAGQTHGEIGRSIDKAQTALLKVFFGNALPGALNRLKDFVIPQGLTRDTLEKYGEVALRTIERGKDTEGVQAVRLELVKRALATLPK